MNRIKKLRMLFNVSQKELSRMAGISQPYLHDLENNNRGARPRTLQRIADALGVTVDKLLEEDKKVG